MPLLEVLIPVVESITNAITIVAGIIGKIGSVLQAINSVAGFVIPGLGPLVNGAKYGSPIGSIKNLDIFTEHPGRNSLDAATDRGSSLASLTPVRYRSQQRVRAYTQNPDRGGLAIGRVAQAESRVRVAQAHSARIQESERSEQRVDVSGIETKLTQLIGAVKAGQNIYMGPEKVGHTINVESSRIG